MITEYFYHHFLGRDKIFKFIVIQNCQVCSQFLFGFYVNKLFSVQRKCMEIRHKVHHKLYLPVKENKSMQSFIYGRLKVKF